MPVEIKELVIQASLQPTTTGTTEENTLLTPSDVDELRREIIQLVSNDNGAMLKGFRRQVIDECMRNIHRLLEEERRLR
ncbi:hypothetical protein CLV84_1037 [Neolewinella xylanilytica]|uniref:Uncharacterized protein n=1 Tax=Neolewinella xylanilytica TaxID=1514080 RepID=A0A2S6I995_9BACT|nr:DUF5908 family protein [Neolewinella xylanilytica]PPK88074.1 hypothetical protein CLV84_1037 [Neolewinella xylanilytica]